jgi:hypothetical protein
MASVLLRDFLSQVIEAGDLVAISERISRTDFGFRFGLISETTERGCHVVTQHNTTLWCPPEFLIRVEEHQVPREIRKGLLDALMRVSIPKHSQVEG